MAKHGSGLQREGQKRGTDSETIVPVQWEVPREAPIARDAVGHRGFEQSRFGSDLTQVWANGRRTMPPGPGETAPRPQMGQKGPMRSLTKCHTASGQLTEQLKHIFSANKIHAHATRLTATGPKGERGAVTHPKRNPTKESMIITARGADSKLGRADLRGSRLLERGNAGEVRGGERLTRSKAN